MHDYRKADLSPRERALCDFAVKLTRLAAEIGEADIDALRAHGLSDAETFDVIAAAAARCFFSKVLDAVGAQPDARYAELDAPLRETLTVGRPIAEA